MRISSKGSTVSFEKNEGRAGMSSLSNSVHFIFARMTGRCAWKALTAAVMSPLHLRSSLASPVHLLRAWSMPRDDHMHKEK